MPAPGASRLLVRSELRGLLIAALDSLDLDRCSPCSAPASRQEAMQHWHSACHRSSQSWSSASACVESRQMHGYDISRAVWCALDSSSFCVRIVGTFICWGAVVNLGWRRSIGSSPATASFTPEAGLGQLWHWRYWRCTVALFPFARDDAASSPCSALGVVDSRYCSLARQKSWHVNYRGACHA